MTSPDFFPDVPALAALQAQKQPLSTYQLDARLRAPMTINTAVSLERQLPRKTTLAATYLGFHGTHLLRSVNINAPLPGTFGPAVPSSGVRPYGDGLGNRFLYESGGLSNVNLFATTVNTRISPKLSFVLVYEGIRQNSDVDGIGSPSNPYNFRQDYGRSTGARSNYANVIANIVGPFGLRFNPLLVIASGPAYDLFTGHDLNGDTLANDRPAFATDLSRPSVVSTRFGAFDTNPMPGQALVPRNYLTGDGMWNINVRVSRNFALGKIKGAPKGNAAGTDAYMPSASLVAQAPVGAGGPREHRFDLTFSFYVNNVLNHLNPGGYVGNLSSPLFGQSTSIGLFRDTSNNRLLQFGTRLSF